MTEPAADGIEMSMLSIGVSKHGDDVIFTIALTSGAGIVVVCPMDMGPVDRAALSAAVAGLEKILSDVTKRMAEDQGTGPTIGFLDLRPGV